MPSKTKRAILDLSAVDTQQKIEFPCRKTRSTRSTKTKSLENEIINTVDEKQQKCNKGMTRKRTILTDENASPYKSPRKCQSPLKSPMKSPLVDVSNIPMNTPPQGVVKRKILLEEMTKSKALSPRSLRQALHTSIPANLIGRDHEQSVINSFITETMVNQQPGSLYLSGAPGTGKTACLTKALDQLEGSKCKKYQSYFINCMSIKCSQNIFSKVASELSGNSKPFTSKDAQKYLETKCKSSGPRILLVLDEIDQLESKNQDVLYKLFEMPFLQKSRLVLIGIANALDLTDRILPRLQSKSACKPMLLQFSPYSKDQISEILKARIKEIGSSDIDPMAIQFCARKVHAITGDVRKALDILRRAVEVKESIEKKKKKAGELDKPMKVTLAHVASVCSEVYGSRLSSTSSTTANSFPLQQKLVICSLMVCLRDKKVKEVTTGKLHEVYSRVCKSRHVTGITNEEMSSVCTLLESQGIISIKKTKDKRNDKVTLRLQENEVEHALQDKTLISSILEEHAKKST